MEKEKLKIGQVITIEHDMEVKALFSDKKILIPKGNKLCVGADKRAHWFRDGAMQPFDSECYEITDERDVKGMLEFVFYRLGVTLPMDEILEYLEEEWEITQDKLIDEIEFVLDDLGIY